MTKFYTLTFFLCLFFGINEINAQKEWTGSTITFTKTNNADWTLEANQDRITNNVWITRANSQSIFNISDINDTSSGDCRGTSPSDTEWAFGTIADGVGTLMFDTFLGGNFADCAPPSVLNRNAVLHLITDDIYIDIKFLSWSSGGSGGGISYQRSTENAVDPNLSTTGFELSKEIKLFPNPSTNYIQIQGLTKIENYKIYDVLGTKIREGVVSSNDRIDIKNLTNGIYFLKFDNGNTLKLLKE